MTVRVLMRLLGVLALLPALAGCAAEAEPLDRADLGADAAKAQSPAPRWVAPEDATLRPGTWLHTESGGCPVNFVFARADNGAVFVGTTAYCVRDLPLGAIAFFGEEHDIAVLIYHSFQSMQDVGETDPDALEYNDFAVFHVDRSSTDRVSPALPGGGPVALADGGAYAVGDRVRMFSPSPRLPNGTEWREGVVSGAAGEWALLTYGVLPSAPGEMGGVVLDPEGRAVGVLVTLGVVPNPGANGVARLDTMMAYAREHAKLPMDLATWP